MTPASSARVPRAVVSVSIVVFVLTGIAYLVAPAAALGVVAVESIPATEFLLRTEGVALLFGAAMLLLVRRGTAAGPLAALAGYYVLSSAVDAIAFAQEIVGPASVPSVIVRVAVGLLCAALAIRSRSAASVPDPS